MATSEEINELKNLILDRFDKLYDDRVTKKDFNGLKKDFNGVKKDLERVENKLERKIERLEDKVDLKIDGVSSQVKELNEKAFSDQGSLGNRVTRLEKDSRLIKKIGSIVSAIIIVVAGAWLTSLFL